MTGTYRVLNSYDDAFIAEVLVSNGGRTAVNWTVVLRFPGTVGRLITSWVESAPQASLTSSGQTYTWRSGVPVPAGSSVPLRFPLRPLRHRRCPGHLPGQRRTLHQLTVEPDAGDQRMPLRVKPCTK